MAAVVATLLAPFRQGEELVAHVDERHPRHDSAQVQLEEAPVEGQRLLDAPHFQRDVVDADQAGGSIPAAFHDTGGVRDGNRVLA